MGTQFAAATARADVTPPPGIAHANWGAQRHECAAGVDLPLWATALALGDGEETVVVVDLDVLYLPPETARHARGAVAERTGLPESHVRVSYTHTHSGPSLHTDVWVERGVDLVEPYVAGLIDQAAGVAWEAVESLRPARLAAGTGRCEIAVNRRFRRPEDGAVVVGRNPDGPVDHEVGVVRVDGTDGEPIATLLDYACHPITVGPDCDLVTPDYPGQAKRTVEAATESTCLFLQGAAGDVGPVRGVARGGLEEYRPLGRRLGHAASRVWWRLDPTGRREHYAETLPSGAPLAVYETEHPDPPDREIRVGTREISLDVRDLPSPGEAREAYDRATERLADLRERDVDEEAVGEAVTEARRAGIRAGVAERFAGRETASWELQAFALGDDVALAAVPGEPFVEIGRHVKAASPFETTLFSGYSNAGLAYVPTADAYSEGGYEVEITPFAPGADARIAGETLAELAALA